MKENQELVQTPGMTPISDSINTGINDLLRAMKADFGQKFTSRFIDERELKDYKQRLRKLFENHSVADIYDAYECYLDTRPEWPPTNIDLRSHLDDLLKERRRQEANKSEAEDLSVLPPSKPIQAQPERLLAAMRTAFSTPKASEAERRAKLAQLEQLHNARIAVDKARGLIKSVHVDAEHTCCHSFCNKPGALTHSTSGSSNWYCGDHFQS